MLGRSTSVFKKVNWNGVELKIPECILGDKDTHGLCKTSFTSVSVSEVVVQRVKTTVTEPVCTDFNQLPFYNGSASGGFKEQNIWVLPQHPPHPHHHDALMDTGTDEWGCFGAHGLLRTLA